MAETETQRQSETGRTSGGQAPTPAPEPTPGLEAARAVTATGAAGAAAIVRIVRQYPMERDEIMAWLHQHRGNQFVQQVTSQLGQIEQALPEGVELQSVRATVTLPAGKKLSGTWQATVATRNATSITVEVNQTGVRAWLSPTLFVDATWPLQNAHIRAAGVRFADGRPYAEVTDGSGLGSGMISIADRLEQMLVDVIGSGIAGTPFARPGYVPTQDADLAGTLERVVAGFSNAFAGEGAPAARPGAVGAADLQQVSAGGTVALRAGGTFLQDGNGVVIAPGSELSMTVQGGGSVQDLMGAGTPAAAADAAAVQAVRVAAGGLEVMAKGKPIARISALTLHRGGAVTIDQMELLGAAGRARGTEAGLSLLVGLIALAGRDPAARGALENAQDPQIVDGIARATMEREFTTTVQRMVLQYRSAVPGIDLARVLGIG